MHVVSPTHQAAFNTVCTTLESVKRIAIGGHANPDGDCIGSCLAMGSLLEKMGKDVVYFSPSLPSQYFSFLPKSQHFVTDSIDSKQFDHIIFLDIANQERSNLKDQNISSLSCPLTVIDHHFSNSFVGGTHIVDGEISSCCELVAKLIYGYNESLITPEIATYLLMGILTDTGNFMRGQHPDTTYEIASFLTKQGADKELLVRKLFRSNSFTAISFAGTLLERIKFHETSIIRSRQNSKELEEKGLDRAKAESGLFMMTSIDHDGIFILFKVDYTESGNRVKMSFRTKNKSIDVAHIAATLGGGGHKAAAGAKVSLQGTEQEMFERILSHVHQEYLKTL